MTKETIFICFSSKDEAVARQVVAFLEANGFTCWISARDVEPGQNYQESIVQALEASKLIVFLFSENSSRSGEIKKELSLGGSESIPVIPLRLSPITPTGALRYELATRQWIDAFPEPAAAFGKLLISVKETWGHSSRGVPPQGAPLAQATGSSAAPLSPAPSLRAPVITPGSEGFEAIRSLLARHVGPIAKVLMQKTAAGAESIEDF